MNNLREQIEMTIAKAMGQDGIHDPAVECADAILAILPKPTVRAKCQECGGNGKRVACGRENCEGCMAPQDCEQAGIYKPCPSCTDGWNEHLIVWECADHECLEDCEWCRGGRIKPLTLPDLIDPDVAAAYGLLLTGWARDTRLINPFPIANNKGTLRIGEKVAG